MNRKELNEHVHQQHSMGEEMYLAAAVDAREGFHEYMHSVDAVSVPHSHAEASEWTLMPASMKRLMNVHLHWQHRGSRPEAHEAMHEAGLADHTHEWPLTEEALEAHVEKHKKAEAKKTEERRERVKRTRASKETQ